MTDLNVEPYVAPVRIEARGPRGLRGPELELRELDGILQWRVVKAIPEPWQPLIDIKTIALQPSDIGTGEGQVAAGDHTHAHFTATNNPHSVDKSQVGLGNLTNDAQMKISANLSDVADSVAAFANIKQAASTISTGVVELATSTEGLAGSDEQRVPPVSVVSEMIAASPPAGLGIGQAWQTVTRAMDTSYQNATVLPIWVTCSATPVSGILAMVCEISNDNASWFLADSDTVNISGGPTRLSSVGAAVPASHYYRFRFTEGTTSEFPAPSFRELR